MDEHESSVTQFKILKGSLLLDYVLELIKLILQSELVEIFSQRCKDTKFSNRELKFCLQAQNIRFKVV